MAEKQTMLQRYWTIRLDFEARCKDAEPTIMQIWSYQELVYRIGVLEVLQILVNSAPVSNDMKVLNPHYAAVNRFIDHLRKERFHLSSDAERQKQQQTATASLTSVVEDYRQRFCSYVTGTPEQYKEDIKRTVGTVLPAWVVYRNTITEINIIIEEAA